MENIEDCEANVEVEEDGEGAVYVLAVCEGVLVHLHKYLRHQSKCHSHNLNPEEQVQAILLIREKPLRLPPEILYHFYCAPNKNSGCRSKKKHRSHHNFSG